MEEFLETLDLNENLKKLFELLGSFETKEEEIAKAKELAASYPVILSAITDLETLSEYLKLYGIEKYISFELGIISNYQYYTGIIFYGYTFGTGEPIVKGGRYDSLLASFGKDAPAIGFAIVVDQLLAAIQRQKITLTAPDYNVLLVFEEKRIAEAVKKAEELRGQGFHVAMIPMNTAHDKAYYTEYAMQNRYAKVEWMDGEK